MAYRCTACGHKMKRAAAHGGCAACGAAAVVPLKRLTIVEREKPRKTKFEILMLVILWGLLFYWLYDRFITS